MIDYKKAAFHGVSWLGGLRLAIRGMGFFRIALLARLLTPEDFGVFGIASLIMSFLEVASDTGINVFLIQEQSELKKYLNTAWVISVLRGVGIATILVFLAPYIGNFFGSPGSVGLLMLISVVPLIRGFINPAEIQFRKDLKFGSEFWFRFGIYFVDALVTITATYITRSPIALVIGLAAGSLFEVVISFLLIRPRPRLGFVLPDARVILSRGKWITSAGFLDYLFQEGDNIVVGKLMNAASLGYYDVAYTISSLPITEISNVFTRVTFPVFAKMESNRAQLKNAFLKTLAVVSLLAAPIGIVLFVFPRPIVSLVLGDKWLPAVEAIKVLSVFGVLKAVTALPSSLFLSVKKQEYVLWVTLTSIVGMGVTIVPFVERWGIVGAGLSALCGTAVSVPLLIYFVYRVFSSKR